MIANSQLYDVPIVKYCQIIAKHCYVKPVKTVSRNYRESLEKMLRRATGQNFRSIYG